MIELHTGAYANAAPEGGEAQFLLLKQSAEIAHSLGIQVNAGHGITMSNLPKLMGIPNLGELNIGHHLVARGVFTGLGQAVRDMKTLMSGYGQIGDSAMT
jgi:pyridoxine 5-phosphate synthase